MATLEAKFEAKRWPVGASKPDISPASFCAWLEKQRGAGRRDDAAQDAGFLARLAQRGARRRFTPLEVALWKNPFSLATLRTDEEDLDRPLTMPEDDAAGLRGSFHVRAIMPRPQRSSGSYPVVTR